MSHSIEVPGGSVEFYDHLGELTPRRKRPVDELALQLGNLMQRMASAKKITGALETDDEETAASKVLNGPDVEVSPHQAALLAKFSDEVTFLWAKAWTLDLPFPASADALLDLPGPVYDAMTKEAARLYVAGMKGENLFEAGDESIADPNSPTGASDV